MFDNKTGRWSVAYDELFRLHEEKERKVTEKLAEKEKEIQRLKQQLQEEKMKSRRTSVEPQMLSKKTQEQTMNRLSICRPQSSRSPHFRQFINVNETFKPEINEKSRKLVQDKNIQSSIHDALYQESKDREERHRSRVKSEISKSRQRANSRNTSTERNNTRLIAKKLCKDLTNACKANGVAVNRVICYQEMVKVIYSMGYILDNITQYEKLLIDNMFNSV